LERNCISCAIPSHCSPFAVDGSPPVTSNASALCSNSAGTSIGSCKSHRALDWPSGTEPSCWVQATSVRMGQAIRWARRPWKAVAFCMGQTSCLHHHILVIHEIAWPPSPPTGCLNQQHIATLRLLRSIGIHDKHREKSYEHYLSYQCSMLSRAWKAVGY